MGTPVDAPTPRQRFIMALEGRQPPGLVPTFELVFYLTMELLGKTHPSHRSFAQWDQMSSREKRLQVADAGATYIETARHFGHSAIFVHGIAGMPDAELRTAEYIREKTGQEYFLMCHGDATLGMPGGGYIYSTSNCVYTGMSLSRYELMMDVWRREGIYRAA
jgi:uroporphyrinogen decarboxylase